MLNESVLLAIIGFSLFIFWACVCRIRQSSKRVKLRVRNRYTIIGTGALFSAFGFWVFPFHGGELYGIAIFIGSVAVGFLLDKEDWHGGPPPSALKGDSSEHK